MFYLMRHAKPDYSFIKLNDPICFSYLAPLCEKSRQYVRNLEISDIKVDLIVASPFTRALETAYLMSEKLGKNVIVEPLLHEWLPVKDCNGKAYQILEENDNFRYGVPGKYESLAECKDRLITVFEKYDEQNILFVGHARLFSTVLGKEINFAQIVPLNY